MNVERQALETRRSQLALAAEEGKKGAAAELEEIEEQLERLDRGEERRRLADQARADREREQRKEKQADALMRIEAMLLKLEDDFEKQLRALRSKPDPKRDDVIPVYLAGRKAYACSHDLYTLTGDHRHRRRWDIREKLGPDLSDLIREFFIGNVRKPVVDRPWAKDFEIAKQAA